MVKNLPVSAGDARDAGRISGLGRSPGGGNGNPLQQSHSWAYTPRKPDLKETCAPNVHRSTVYNSQDMEASPSADERIRKLWYIYTMEYHSAIRKNSFESVLMRWMKLEPIIQSEVSQKDKEHYSLLTHIYGI